MFILMSEDCEIIGCSNSAEKCMKKLYSICVELSEDAYLEPYVMETDDPNVKIYELRQEGVNFATTAYSIEKVEEL
jgi:DNA-binding PadR family transcriptional regulator